MPRVEDDGHQGSGDGERRRRATLAVLITLGCMSALGPLTSDFYLPGLPGLAADLHTSNAAAQFTLALSLAGIGVGQLFVGPYSDRHGRRKPMLLGLGMYVAATVLCATAPTIQLLLVFRFTQGLAGASAWVLARATVRDLYTGIGAAKVFSQLTLVTGLAPILSPVVGAELLKVMGWRGLFWVLAGMGLAVFAACAVVLRESLTGEAKHTSAGGHWQQMRNIIRDRRFQRYIVSTGMQGAVFFAYLSMGPFVLQHTYGLSPQQYSFVFGGNAVLGVLGSQLNGAIVHRYGPSLLLRWQLGLMTAGSAMVLIAGATHAPLLFMLLAIFVVPACGMPAMANTTALVLMPYSHAAGAAAAWQGACQFLLGAILPPAVALLVATTSVVMGATMTATVLLGWLAVLTAKRSEEETALLAGGAQKLITGVEPEVLT